MKEGLPRSLVRFSGFTNFIRFQTYGLLFQVFYFCIITFTISFLNA